MAESMDKSVTRMDDSAIRKRHKRAKRPLPISPSSGEDRRIRDGFPGQRRTRVPVDVIRRKHAVPVVGDLYITDIGHFPTARYHYVDRPQGLTEVILIYCTDGAGLCEMRGRKWQIKSGWALMIPPGTPHLYHAHPGAPWSIYWLHFGGKRVQAFLDVLGVSPAGPMMYVPDEDLVIQAFEEVYGHLEQGYSDMGLLGLSTSLGRLLGILGCRQRAPDVRGRCTQEKIMESIQYMREHIDTPCRSEELAEAANMSLSTYGHTFRKQMNTSPGHFFIRLKMQRACEYLDTTDMTVRAIGERVGYGDQFHFCRVFKKVIGKTPTDYRNCIHEVYAGW